MELAKRRRETPLTRWPEDLWSWFDGLFGSSMGMGLVPALDVEEGDDKIMVHAELPGVDPKDVDVSIRNDMLTITGEKREEEERKERGGFFRSERRYGTFSREIRLPANVDPSKIQAKCHNGVLTITLPKVETAKPKKIEVKIE